MHMECRLLTPQQGQELELHVRHCEKAAVRVVLEFWREGFDENITQIRSILAEVRKCG